MKRSISICPTICLCIIFSCTSISANRNTMKITKNKAIELADIEAKKLGYDISIMNTRVDEYSTPWNEYLPKESNDQFSIEKKNKLKNKKYWAVYYYPNREKVGLGYKGGDFCIFIDSTTGEIITDIRWK